MIIESTIWSGKQESSLHLFQSAQQILQTARSVKGKFVMHIQAIHLSYAYIIWYIIYHNYSMLPVVQENKSQRPA